MPKDDTTKPDAPASNFIKEIINEDLKTGKYGNRVATRFPPEPNGYLHIGHAKAICLNFGLAEQYKGTCNLRFDDTNPAKEETEYVESIKEDIRWLGFDWDDRLYFASDYFDKLYEFAEQLIRKGLAYVDDMTEEQIREYRGNYYTKAKQSPYRDRGVDENLDLFQRMKAGEFEDGSRVLRAKVDMESPNMNMRDPVMYRIRKASHHRTGDKWCIYPMYDFAHGQSDAIENITHSICTLEFQDHRPLYDWFCEKIGFENPPNQYEMARLNLNYTVMSKRRLLQLVERKIVGGWDDPRMPTISALRRRGFPPTAIRKFSERVGVAKANSIVDLALLEHTVREELNETSPRLMAVLDPLEVVIENFPEGKVEKFDAPYYPDDFSKGSREVPLTRVIYVDRDDFREDPPKKWHRLAPGKEVRLRYGCLITCKEVIKDDDGKVIRLICNWDPESKGGNAPDGRKVRGTIHWVSAEHALPATVRLYDRLFTVPNPMDVEEGKDFFDYINPDSLKVMPGCKVEPDFANAKPGERYQFERLGYFCVDTKESKAEALVFNRTVTLRDSWAKIEKAQAKAPVGKKKSSKGKNDPSHVTIKDFAKLDLCVGKILEASTVKGADKLLKLTIDIGEGKPRCIFSGIRQAYPSPKELVGKTVGVLANIKPRKMKFGTSEGMVLTGGDDDKTLGMVTFDKDLKPGERIS